MSRLDDHPTVRGVRERRADAPEAGTEASAPLDAEELRRLCLEAGADDVGFVEVGRAEIADQRADIEAALPRARALISFVCRTNVEAIRTPAREISNEEFHHTTDEVTDVGHRLCRALQDRGVRAISPAAGFPMDQSKFPGKMWVVSHKPVAVAAGLGEMGIHRNVIHPRFGNFVLLGTVIIDVEVSTYDRPVTFNPCLECKLCVAACPTGAISKTGEFSFSACATHNYRDFMTGFGDWVENIADSSNARQYRDKVADADTASMWQSLSFGAQYKAAYCMAVCPAGEDVIGPFLDNRKQHVADVVKPLQDKQETVYVVKGGDPEEYVERRFSNKTIQQVGLTLRPATIDHFVLGLPLLFQRRPAEGLDATYHFTFTGSEEREVTVTIREQELTVTEGLDGTPDLAITADATTWIDFLATGPVRQMVALPAALARRTMTLHGDPRLLLKFSACFPT